MAFKNLFCNSGLINDNCKLEGLLPAFFDEAQFGQKVIENKIKMKLGMIEIKII